MKGGDSILKKMQLLLAFVVALFVVGTFGVQAASAHTNKPTITTQNQNKDDDNNRPGWGFGDDNHHHVGPPGHSVRPGDGDHDRDDHGDKISDAKFKQFLAELQQLFHKFFG